MSFKDVAAQEGWSESTQLGLLEHFIEQNALQSTLDTKAIEVAAIERGCQECNVRSREYLSLTVEQGWDEHSQISIILGAVEEAGKQNDLSSFAVESAVESASVDESSVTASEPRLVSANASCADVWVHVSSDENDEQWRFTISKDFEFGDIDTFPPEFSESGEVGFEEAETNPPDDVVSAFESRRAEAEALLEKAAVAVKQGVSWHELGARESFDKWANNAIQFPRLLCEIMATQNLDLNELADSMNLEVRQVTELFDRANLSWEAAKLDTDRAAKPKAKLPGM